MHFDFYILHLTIYIKGNNVIIQLKSGKKVIDSEGLTIDRDFDTLLITVLDKFIVKHKISRLSLKSIEIRGIMRSESVSSMILKTIEAGLGI